jgi:hypothetical protein
MRKYFLFSIFSALLILMSFRKPVVAKISINDAVLKGLVKIKLNGAGGHSGRCVTGEIQNLKGQELNITFLPGHRLNSADDTEQDLLIVREQMIVLSGSEKKNLDLSAFCCQLTNKSPGQGSGFKLGKSADEKLVKLSKFINGLDSLPDGVLQEAVWCISNNNNPSNIALYSDGSNENSHLKKNVDSLRKFVCKTTGKPDTWYSTPQNRFETPERIIQPNPVEVYGTFSYEVTTPTTLNSELIDPQGKVFFKMPGKEVKRKGKWDYEFQVYVKGFPPGNYHIVLKSGNTVIVDKEFTI